ncbi:BPTI/Kunitz domain-containing protein [Brienomyrus brachyistius]|uniref:BPTI/Kunitz domain-containing protein n=1 Tax=Brienomyrus brachyistius TaxID=42636 RepID=UPI0020B2BF49|nr:BPTI/Kunitz domain-containing protein [Brienomyrus brachyistius]
MNRLVALVVLSILFHTVLAQQSNVCDLPMDEGQGTDHFPRLYFDMTKDKCVPFAYKGQGGNGNRFITDKMCMRNCSLKAEEIYPKNEIKVCRFPKSVGDCLSHYLLWYYDPIIGKCKNFYYSGCGGNGNRFINATICESTCAGVHDLPSSDNLQPEDDESDTPVGLIIGILLGVLGAIIIIIVVVVSVKKKKSNGVSKNKKELDVPLNDRPVEVS